MKIVLDLLGEHKEFHRRQAEWPIDDDRTKSERADKVRQEHRECQLEFEKAINILEGESNFCQCKNPWINPKGGSYECMSCDKEIK